MQTDRASGIPGEDDLAGTALRALLACFQFYAAYAVRASTAMVSTWYERRGELGGSMVVGPGIFEAMRQ